MPPEENLKPLDSVADGKWHEQGSGGRGGGRCGGRRRRLAQWEEADSTRLCAGLVEKAKKLPGDCFYEKPESRSSLRSVGAKKKAQLKQHVQLPGSFFLWEAAE